MYQSPPRSYTLPLADRTHALAHPQAPLHLLRAHVARAPSSPPLSVYSSTYTTPSSAEAASPPIRGELARIQNPSLASLSAAALAPALPDPTAPLALMPKSRPVRKATLSMFSEASNITIVGGSITNAGGNIFSRGGTFTHRGGANDTEIEDSEDSSDDHVEVSAFENVTGLKAVGATIVNAGGDVLSSINGPSPKNQGYNVHTHMFTRAENARLEHVEVIDAAGSVIEDEWSVIYFVLCDLTDGLLAQTPVNLPDVRFAPKWIKDEKDGVPEKRTQQCSKSNTRARSH